MSESPFEIIAAPAKVYLAPTGTSMPAINADPTAGGWTYLGYTDGGVEVSHTQTINYLKVDQITVAVKAIRPDEGMTVTFSLAQITLENYAFALGKTGPTLAGGSPSTRYVKIYQGVSVKRWSMLVRGDSPYVQDTNLQYEIPVVVQSGTPKIKFVRDDKAVLACEFTTLADPNTADADKFGLIRAQDA